jgi:hypothetical protein
MTMGARNPAMSSGDGERSGRRDWRLGRFPNLMPRRIQEVLLVASPYDAFVLEEDGLLSEMLYTEYHDLGLTHAPNITRVSTGAEALAAVARRPFDLIITMLRLGDMEVMDFAAAVKDQRPVLPVALLVSSEWELARITHSRDALQVDSVYVWHGDTKLFLAIIKVLEDRMNVDHDTEVGDVGVIVIVEDSVRFRSSLLPLIYSQLVTQTQRVMAEGLNHRDKLLRMRARPKVLVADTFERGMEFYTRYRKHIFGVITDVSFPRQGRQDPRAGIEFIRAIKSDLVDVPAVLQSSDVSNAALAHQIGARFLHKRSTTLLEDLGKFMLDNFGFGDFVFRAADGQEVARAPDLRTMARVLRDVPAESIEYHAVRNHFSNWLRARTEFALARRLRPRRVSEFQNLEDLRRFLARGIADALSRNRHGLVEDFSRQRFDGQSGIARLGGGSMGGKARGLAFVDALLSRTDVEAEFDNVRITVPPSVVIGTDVFDEFLEMNALRHSALCADDDGWVTQQFMEARLPEPVVEDLRAFIEIVHGPLAVRSSSLLEDSQYHPFAGVYDTHMLPNDHEDLEVRLLHLCDAIKLVYASTFFSAARRYLNATPYRIEEERMAVILQRVVGGAHGQHVYPNIAGVARSYNFYPFGAMRPEDGVASVAMGLGQTVVDGGRALRFCPGHPHVLPQMADPEEFINQSQRTFYAIDLRRTADAPRYTGDPCVVRLDLDDAETHGTLNLLGSTWSPDNQAFYDGTQRPGVRVVTFAHVLKNEAFPLAPILRRLLDVGRTGMNAPVEVEFAVDLEADPKEFAVLQLRPCGTSIGREQVDLGHLERDELLCYSEHALGNGVIAGLRDVIYVKPEDFDPAHTPRIAAEISELNKELMAANRPCMMIGPGRWGSSHSWLGIPVEWSQISAARIIVEATLEDFIVEPSQGSHFFQNLTSFGIVYLTVNPFADSGFIDWAWLDGQRARYESDHVRHVELDEPLEARVDGEISHAAIMKRALRLLAE